MVIFFVFWLLVVFCFFFFFSSRRRHTRLTCDWSSDVCSSDLAQCGACVDKKVSRASAALSTALRADLTASALRMLLGVLGLRRWLYMPVRRERSEEHTSDSSHMSISYAVFCLKKKNKQT